MEKGEVKIAVIGDPGVGKTSLITAAATETFPDHPPPVLPPTRLSADSTPEGVPILITDTLSRPEDRPALEAACLQADVIVLAFDTGVWLLVCRLWTWRRSVQSSNVCERCGRPAEDAATRAHILDTGAAPAERARANHPGRLQERHQAPGGARCAAGRAPSPGSLGPVLLWSPLGVKVCCRVTNAPGSTAAAVSLLQSSRLLQEAQVHAVLAGHRQLRPPSVVTGCTP